MMLRGIIKFLLFFWVINVCGESSGFDRGSITQYPLRNFYCPEKSFEVGILRSARRAGYEVSKIEELDEFPIKDINAICKTHLVELCCKLNEKKYGPVIMENDGWEEFKKILTSSASLEEKRKASLRLGREHGARKMMKIEKLGELEKKGEFLDELYRIKISRGEFPKIKREAFFEVGLWGIFYNEMLPNRRNLEIEIAVLKNADELKVRKIEEGFLSLMGLFIVMVKTTPSCFLPIDRVVELINETLDSYGRFVIVRDGK